MIPVILLVSNIYVHAFDIVKQLARLLKFIYMIIPGFVFCALMDCSLSFAIPCAIVGLAVAWVAASSAGVILGLHFMIRVPRFIHAVNLCNLNTRNSTDILVLKTNNVVLLHHCSVAFAVSDTYD